MILTTHAAVGTAVGQALKRYPLLAIIAAFLSHFVLDAIPHWDFDLSSADHNHENKLDYDLVMSDNFFHRDLPKIILDGLGGLFIAYIIARPQNLHDFIFVMATAFAAMFPDALQFLYYRLRVEPFVAIQKFHIWIATKYEFPEYPPLGITMQIILIIIMYALTAQFRV